MAKLLAATQKLDDAFADFKKSLEPAELDQLKAANAKPQPSDVVDLVSQIDKSRTGRSKLKWGFRKLVESRCRDFLRCVQQFSSVADTFSQINPEVSCLIWGAVKLVLIVSMNVVEYFEKVSESLQRIGNICRPFQDFQALFPNSQRLQDSLSEFYTQVVYFCKEALGFARRSALKQAVSAAWKPYQVRFGDIEAELAVRKEQIMIEIALEKELARRRELQKDILFKDTVLQNHQSITDQSTAIHDLVLKNQQELVLYQKNSQELQLLDKKTVKREQLLEKISNYDHRASFDEAYADRKEGTGQWFPDSNEFKDWIQRDKSTILYCTGIPGSGKTFLTAGVIKAIFCGGISQSNFSMGYFFSSYRDQESMKRRTILRSLLRQILGQHERYPASLMTSLENAFGNRAVSSASQDLVNLLTSASELSSTTFLVLDGLDEIRDEDERHRFFGDLLELIRPSHNTKHVTKIFIASRHEPDIMERLKYCEHIQLDVSKNTADIETYINDEIVKMNEEKRRRNAFSPELVAEIRSTLSKKARGMFLWVKYQLKDIFDQTTEERARKAMRNLPRDLPETYRRILKNIIRDRDPELPIRILKWLAFAKRPLTLAELAEATAIEPGDSFWNGSQYSQDPVILVKQCGHLVVWDASKEEEGVLKFAHLSILEFLGELSPSDSKLSAFRIDKTTAHSYIANVCLTYINFTDFQTQLANIPKEREKPVTVVDVSTSSYVSTLLTASHPMVGQFLGPVVSYFSKDTAKTKAVSAPDLRKLMPDNSNSLFKPIPELKGKYRLLEYAAIFWIDHCEAMADLTVFRELVIKKTLPKDFLPWESSQEWAAKGLADESPASIQKIFRWAVYSGYGNIPSYLHGYVRLEFPNFVPILIDMENPDLGEDPLLRASKLGYTNVVRFILETEAAGPLMPKQFKKEGSLICAAAEGYVGIVELFLATITNDGMYRSDVRSALQAAAGAGHLAVVEVMLSHIEERHLKLGSYYGRGTLQQAAYGCHPAVVERLLAAGADVNEEPDNDGYTALQAAAGRGHFQLVERLLAAGATVNAPPAQSDGLGALATAASHGHTKIVERLLAAGAHVNAYHAEHKGLTPLQAAAGGGHLQIVDIFLIAGAVVNAGGSSEHGRTALQAAAGGGHLDVIERLLAAGAQVNADLGRDGGRTALQAAAGGGHLAVVEKLLAAGAHVNANPTRVNGRTALQAAAEGNHLAVVERLLAAKADINASGSAVGGYTALEAAVHGGNLPMVQRLLAAGADHRESYPDKRSGRSPVLLAVEGGHLAILKELLSAKAAPIDRRPFGIPPLIVAVKNGDLEIVKELLANKARVNDTDGIWGNTALIAAARDGNLELIELLITAKADLNAKNQDGATALTKAEDGGHIAVRDRLLAAGAARAKLRGGD